MFHNCINELTPCTTEEKLCSSKGFVASEDIMSSAYGKRRSPKKSVDSRGSCVGMLSIEHTNTPGPLKLKQRVTCT